MTDDTASPAQERVAADSEHELFELTNEEVIGLAVGSELPIPRFLDRDIVDDWSEEVRKAVAVTGIRSLAARGLVRQGESALEMPGELAHLVRCMCRPSIVAAARYASPDRVDAVMLYSTPDWVAGHRPGRLGNHRFTLFPTERLLEVLMAVAGVGETAGADADTSLEGSVRLSDLVPASSAPAASQHVGETLLDALRDTTATAGAIAAVYPTEDGKIFGGEVSWLLTAERSLALVERSVDEDGMTVLNCRATTTDEIVALARGVLPATSSA